MSNPFRMSEAAALALHAAAILAGEARRAKAAGTPDRPVTSRQMAEALGASEGHLSKVLRRLTQAGLVTATRGPGGGFRLGRRGDRVTLLEVYEAVEGPLDVTACLFGRPVCAGKDCICGDLLSEVHERTRRRLAGTQLSELGSTFAGQTA